MSYAQNTSVPISRSKAEIEHLLAKHGADGFASGWEGARATIMFRMESRAVRIHVTMPSSELPQLRREQEERRLWRAMLLVVKAKLEAVASGVETFDEAWLPHIVVPGGKTVGEEVIRRLDAAYEIGKPVPLLGPG